MRSPFRSHPSPLLAALSRRLGLPTASRYITSSARDNSKGRRLSLLRCLSDDMALEGSSVLGQENQNNDTSLGIRVTRRQEQGAKQTLKPLADSSVQARRDTSHA